MTGRSDTANEENFVDPFGRQVTYLRLSVTDRCDLRCTYCMAERMTFLPKADLLTIEELDRLSRAFIARGVRKIRITGGEPLVRRDILKLFHLLGARLGNGLDELTLTTNATRLTEHASELYAAGVRRANISLDSINPMTFARISRRAKLDDVLRGIDTAQEAGLKLKINAVALKDQNLEELPELIAWAHGRGIDVTLIEVMPLGETGEDRFDQYVPLPEVREQLARHWTFDDVAAGDPNGGPARYVRVKETGGKLGFITPLTHNFCAGCNRMRVTCTGRIYMCLGQEDHVDLREVMRSSPDSDDMLQAALGKALRLKPERHEFEIDRPGAAPAVTRHMSMTGG